MASHFDATLSPSLTARSGASGMHDLSMAADVSVIIPAWNAAAYIEAAIRSALSQQGVSLEIIVVDDHSSDDTAELASAIGDARIQVHRLDRNLGPSGARNHAIRHATGRWLAILDADDQYLPGRLQGLTKLGDQMQCAVVADNLLFDRGSASAHLPMFPNRGPTPAHFPITGPDFIRGNRLMHSRYNYGFLKPLFNREFVVQHGIGYDEGIVVGEDYLFLLENLLCGGACLFSETPGYLYRIHEVSVSSQKLSRERIRLMLEADERLLSRYVLDGELALAQAERHRSLLDADAYVAMADGLKSRQFGTFLGHAARRPAALRHFRQPLRDRIVRLAALLRQDRAVTPD